LRKAKFDALINNNGQLTVRQKFAGHKPTFKNENNHCGALRPESGKSGYIFCGNSSMKQEGASI